MRFGLRRRLTSSLGRSGLRWGLGVVAGVATVFGGYQIYQWAMSAALSQGTYVETVVGTVRNLNPWTTGATAADRDLQRLLHSGLLRYNPTNGNIEPALADWSITEAGRRYELTLKPSAYFSDGSLITTEDIVFSYTQVLKHPDFEFPGFKQAVQYLEIEAIDDRTVVFTFPESTQFAPHWLTWPILSQAQFAGAFIQEITDPDYPANQSPIGAGPFRLDNAISQGATQRFFLSANKFYYGGTPRLKKVVINAIPADLFALDADTSAYSGLPWNQLQSLLPGLGREWRVVEYLLPRYTALFFNLDSPLSKNLYLRQALKQGFPYQSILEDDWLGVPEFFFFDREGIPTGTVSLGDVRQARLSLRTSDFPREESTGLRTFGADGDPIQLRAITSTQPAAYSRFIQSLAQYWREELGIKLLVEILSPSEFLNRTMARDYDLVLFGQDFAQTPDSTIAWSSARTGQENLSNLTNASVDQLIQTWRQGGTDQTLQELEARLQELVPAIPFATPRYGYLIRNDDLQGRTPITHWRQASDRFWGIEDWYYLRS